MNTNFLWSLPKFLCVVLGLKFDDIIDIDSHPDAREAVSMLPDDLRQARIRRLLRAADIDSKHTYYLSKEDQDYVRNYFALVLIFIQL